MARTMRLDLKIFELGLATSRTEAKNFVISGAVCVNGRVVTKPAFDVSEGDSVSVDTCSKKYVSRGGLKLEGALKEFCLDVKDALALDVGASSGGFTDCLLKHGVARVVAVDSGSGQMAASLRADDRVTVIENFNARYMSPSDLPFAPSVAVMDVSFISATLIIPAVYACLAPGGDFICLVKPQFEVGRSGIGKGGIVKDEKLRKKALYDVISFAQTRGFRAVNHIVSPIVGGDGNVEFLVHFRKDAT